MTKDTTNVMPAFGRPKAVRTAEFTNEQEKLIEEMAVRHDAGPPQPPNGPQMAPNPPAVSADGPSAVYLQPYRKKKKDVPPAQSAQMTLRGPASVLNRFKAFSDMKGKVQWEMLDDLLDQAGAPRYDQILSGE